MNDSLKETSPRSAAPLTEVLVEQKKRQKKIEVGLTTSSRIHDNFIDPKLFSTKEESRIARSRLNAPQLVSLELRYVKRSVTSQATDVALWESYCERIIIEAPAMNCVTAIAQ